MGSGYTRGLSSRKGWVIWHQERHLDIDRHLALNDVEITGNTDGNVHICRQQAACDMGKMLRTSGACYQEEESEKTSRKQLSAGCLARDRTTKVEETFLKC